MTEYNFKSSYKTDSPLVNNISLVIFSIYTQFYSFHIRSIANSVCIYIYICKASKDVTFPVQCNIYNHIYIYS